MGRRSRDAGADTSRCTRAEILTDTGAASHRNLAFTALVQVSRPCLLAFLAWVVEHRPTQGPSLQLAPCRCPFRLTNSRLELTQGEMATLLIRYCLVWSGCLDLPKNSSCSRGLT